MSNPVRGQIAVKLADARSGPIWRQVLAVLYAYGAFLAVLALRHRRVMRTVFGDLAESRLEALAD